MTYAFGAVPRFRQVCTVARLTWTFSHSSSSVHIGVCVSGGSSLATMNSRCAVATGDQGRSRSHAGMPGEHSRGISRGIMAIWVLSFEDSGNAEGR